VCGIPDLAKVLAATLRAAYRPAIAPQFSPRRLPCLVTQIPHSWGEQQASDRQTGRHAGRQATYFSLERSAASGVCLLRALPS
jgi:hypothetical protein